VAPASEFQCVVKVVRFEDVVAARDLRALGERAVGDRRGVGVPDVAKAVADIEGGKINFRVEKQANLHFVIGKASFDEKALAETTAPRWTRSCAPSRRRRRAAT
jgi:ribosomal protein L1